MNNKIPISYLFKYEDGTSTQYDLILDGETLTPQEKTIDRPAWTELTVQQCENCPLTAKTCSHCPLAMALQPLITDFSNRSSYDTVNIIVTTTERITSTTTSLQRGLSSLLGLVMATSGCPHTTHLKPMARFHLPFASEEETIYRASANYLLAQYFKEKNKQDWQIKEFAEIYQQLQIVNRGISQRLKEVCTKDATVNAVVLLDLYAKDIPYCIEETLQEIKYLFNH